MPLGVHAFDAQFAGNATWLASSGTFGLDVSGTVPAITSPASVSFTVGVFGSFTIRTTGTPAPALTLAAGTLPSGLSLVDLGDGTAVLSGSPHQADVGTRTLTILARNAVGEATQALVVRVDEWIAVPTLEGPGLAGLALLLALAGAFALRRGAGA
jgi:hypothetical protein